MYFINFSDIDRNILELFVGACKQYIYTIYSIVYKKHAFVQYKYVKMYF